MSIQITTAMVSQFSANVFHLSQQVGSRLRGLVRSESQKSESAFYDRIGAVTAQKKVSRHADTTYSDTPHSRRRVTLEDFFHADLVDKEDKLRIIQSPESEYAKAAQNALGRAMDDVIIAAALGSSFGGKTGGTEVVLPSTQKIVASDGVDITGTGLNVKTLRLVKKKFHKNETGDSDLHFIVSAEQIDNLLGETGVTSSDFNVIRALVAGDVNSFMGFMFHRSERLPALAANTAFALASGAFGGVGGNTVIAGNDYRKCIAFQKEGVLLAISEEITGKIDRLPTKHYAVQIYASMGLGATRLEEEKVVEVICKE